MVSNTPVSQNDSNVDRANPAAADEALPTITIIDNVEKKPVIMARKACGCLPERTVVIAILTCYFFFGMIRTATYFSNLAFTSMPRYQAMFSLFAIVSLLFAITSAMGMNAIYKEKAVMMRRLSIVLVVLTLAVFALNSTDFIIDIATKDDLSQSCSQELNVQMEGLTPDNNDDNCDHIVSMYLLWEGLSVFFFTFLQAYFAFVILRHARQMKLQAKNPYPLGQNSNNSPTYFVYASSGVPTADNWVPPPTYNGNPNSIRLAEDFKFGSDVANRA